jgi:peptidoglycan/LPS O-acetylase OafA/YrhL
MSISEKNLIRTYLLEKNWILVKLSTYTYGIYLFHSISIDATLFFNKKFPIRIMSYFDKFVVQIIICLGFSYVFYILVERKSIDLAHRICRSIDNYAFKIDLNNV